MLERIREFKLDMDHEVYGVNGCRFYDNQKPLPWVVVVASILVARAWMKLMEHTVCAKFGHDWVDEGYGTPDSGADGGHCERCGWGFFVRMY